MELGGTGGNPYVFIAIVILIALQLLITYAPPMQALFGTAAIGPDVWAGTIGVGIGVFVLVEAEKWVLRSRAAFMRPTVA